MNYVLIAIVVIAVVWAIKTINDFNKKDIKVQESLSDIEVALTNRYDTLTKLIDVTKGYVKYEEETFTNVIKMRQGMSIGEMNEVNKEIDTASQRIVAIAENYPELRSSDLFVELQKQIKDTESHLMAARRMYNNSVKEFNTAITMMPASLLAGGRQQKKYFEAEAIKKNDVKIPTDFRG